ncbi:MFS transporter [Actinacidiphila paucisporea]|uniref:Drug resistance transporter, EmrB/QacA subfamily n=1 Tax=Actinacidiphila paucisporea TaxID=310782 RepID=A0A1M7PMG9_9ACTN|nr:MFS transporter [Actinacidiphila paucisporea]SHN18390.1 drug resistance transporter, EmrB/QacA subfamily [Actinacidiphila paucisporea]
MSVRSAAPAAGPGSGAAGSAPGDSRRWLILTVICTAYLMITLDVTVMNLALPSAQEALHFSNADKQWILTAYALCFGSLLLFCGRLADLVGRKETFLIGLSGFAISSAVGGASGSFGMLVAARASQGVFAALLAPTALSLLSTTFTDPKERGKAFGVFSAVAASGGGLGLLLGGALTSGLNWRWCMYVNLVFAVFSLVGGLMLLPRQPRTGAKMDIPGVIVASGGMFCLVYGFSNAATHSWHAATTWGVLATGGVLLVVFAFWQSRAPHPLLPPRVVLDRNRGGAYLTALIVGVGAFGVLLFLIYYMQTDLGYSAITSGVALLPMVVVTAVATNVGNIVVMPKVGPRPLIGVGMLLNAGGMAWLTRIGPDSGYAAALLGPTMVIGLGMGLIYAAALRTGTAGVAPHDAGIASASISTGQQLGGAIGTALLNTIAASSAGTYLSSHAHGKPTAAQIHLATIHGYSTVFWWCTAIFGVGAVVCAALLRGGPLPAPAFGAPAKPAAPAEKARS